MTPKRKNPDRYGMPVGAAGSMPERVDWIPADKAIDYLASEGRLEHVDPASTSADNMLKQAREFLTAARLAKQAILTSPAFINAYDAARQALTAVLQAQGLRPRGGDGGHHVLFEALSPQFPSNLETVNQFDWMRQRRNDTQYPSGGPPVSLLEADDAISAAEAIIALAAGYLQYHR